MSLRKYITKEFIFLIVVQYIGFKLSFLAAAWGAVEGAPYSYYGAMSFFVFLGVHVWFTGKLWELRFAFTVAFFGTCLDSIYSLTGLITYQGPYPVLDFIAPIWITSIWVGLAVTLDYSLKMLVGRPVWIFISGAIFGPMAHWSGDAMGALDFNLDFWPAMTILAVPWGLAMMGSYWLLEYFRPENEREIEELLKPEHVELERESTRV